VKTISRGTVAAYSLVIFLLVSSEILALPTPDTQTRLAYEAKIEKAEKALCEGLGVKWQPRDQRTTVTLEFMRSVGEELEKTGETDAAIYEYSRIPIEVGDTPVNIDSAYFSIAQCYEGLHDYGKALEVFKEYGEKYGFGGEKGQEYMKDKRLLERGMVRWSFSLAAFYRSNANVGRLYQKMQKYRDALSCYQDYVSVVGRMLGQLNSEDKEWCARSINVDATLDMADCYIALKQHDKALVCLEAAQKYVGSHDYPPTVKAKPDLLERVRRRDQERISRGLAVCREALVNPLGGSGSRPTSATLTAPGALKPGSAAPQSGAKSAESAGGCGCGSPAPAKQAAAPPGGGCGCGSAQPTTAPQPAAKPAESAGGGCGCGAAQPAANPAPPKGAGGQPAPRPGTAAH